MLCYVMLCMLCIPGFLTFAKTLTKPLATSAVTFLSEDESNCCTALTSAPPGKLPHGICLSRISSVLLNNDPNNNYVAFCLCCDVCVYVCNLCLWLEVRVYD